MEGTSPFTNISIITDGRYDIMYLNSKDVAFLLSLACAERLEDLDRAATVVVRLGRKCSDFGLNRFNLVYTDLKLGTIDMGKLEYSSKEMPKRIDKMERLILTTSNLYTTLESLTEMEISEVKLKQWKKNTVAMQEDDGYGENGAGKNNRSTDQPETISLRPKKRTEVHRNRYKVAVDAKEGRRQREDNKVEIRKNQREESLQKKRREGLQIRQFPGDRKLENMPKLLPSENSGYIMRGKP
ncbi:hypothetical protein RJ639_014884 [Escallonia herrerae]|uniref:IBB domain-containing protein n=1 Tax=Escallonia herrerae TaxID=1293975 RepID=A0AA89ANE9_9ASTE|nr:hypothetical protein RJ639_014884 [Escallonia herrerae]